MAKFLKTPSTRTSKDSCLFSLLVTVLRRGNSLPLHVAGRERRKWFGSEVCEFGEKRRMFRHESVNPVSQPDSGERFALNSLLRRP